MIRVGLRADKYVVMKISNKDVWSLELTEDEAADLHAQLGVLLPDEKLIVEFGLSDKVEVSAQPAPL